MSQPPWNGPLITDQYEAYKAPEFSKGIAVLASLQQAMAQAANAKVEESRWSTASCQAT